MDDLDDQIINDFLMSIKTACSFWLTRKEVSEKEKIEGVAFSILSILDGVSSCFDGHMTSLTYHWEDGEGNEHEREVHLESLMLHNHFETITGPNPYVANIKPSKEKVL